MRLQTYSCETPARFWRNSNVINMPAAELTRMVDEIRQTLERNPGSASELVLGFLKQMASSEAGISTNARGRLAPWQERKIERHLKNNLERNIHMDELAAQVRLSASHFCRAFKRSFGETPHGYVVRLRLEFARKLMLTTDDPLSQIALRCGLADQAHLSKLFRRVFQDTPNAWRRRNLSDAQVETTSQIVNTGLRQAA